MLVPLWTCAEATIELGTPEARAMEAAHAFRARRACSRCGSRRATDWRGDGTDCLDCGAWEPPEMDLVTYRAFSDPSRRIGCETRRPGDAGRSPPGNAGRPLPSRTLASQRGARPPAWQPPERECTTAPVVTALAAADAVTDEAPTAALAALLAALAGLSLRIATRLATLDGAATHPPATATMGSTDTLVSASEASRLTGMSTRWLYRHQQKLPFTRRIGPRAVRFSVAGITKWLASRRPS